MRKNHHKKPHIPPRERQEFRAEAEGRKATAFPLIWRDSSAPYRCHYSAKTKYMFEYSSVASPSLGHHPSGIEELSENIILRDCNDIQINYVSSVCVWCVCVRGN